MSKKSPEVEDTEVLDIIGPGSLLSEARIKSGLTVVDVANKLNFRITLVNNIEADIFDKTLPDTYNRGYLKNYAKLVNVSITDVIEMYEKMNVFQENHAKMQSFSRGTMKKTQNNILMWITYLILTIFIVFTVMWWLQEDKASHSGESSPVASTSLPAKDDETMTEKLVQPLQQSEIVEEASLENANNIATTERANNVIEGSASTVNTPMNAVTANNDTITQSLVAEAETVEAETAKIETTVAQTTPEVIKPEETALTKVVFTFAGDCWVNIHDALGERVAWGVKKSGYVMTINVKAPLKITIGKPELVEIDFGGESIDMSTFPKGHIAKFTLPLPSQS